ncbi:ATP-binding cassette domain-containing protein, partial [Bradyrhizobium sp.]|uniref:ATP-binding cassette domain-containing protein n=1 Tax=Bradyrhizobium sp. TaxID=376 RepID=UPI00239226C3
MVDLLSMFRRRPAKRGFARLRGDITALGDTIGSLLTSPLRDAPPIARDQPIQSPDQFEDDTRPQNPHPLRGSARTNGSGTPQLLRRPGFLAVHSVEKSFGSRHVVRGVSIYVRRGEAVGLLGPNGAGKTTVFYMITGLIKADRGAIELDGHDVTRLPMYQRARLGIGYLPQEASIFRG